jgi:hypothetical protein
MTPGMKTQQGRSLYEQDILLWVEDTIAKLKNRDFENLDIKNLIEEVEAVGIAQRRELFSRLNRLLEHLLKRLYVNSDWEHRGWEQTIRHQRVELRKLLQTAPSLKNLWEETVDEAWEAALESVRDDYPNANFPDRFPYATDVEALLNQKYWEMSHE